LTGGMGEMGKPLGVRERSGQDWHRNGRLNAGFSNRGSQ
jgi:hypothetical protein